MTSPEAHLPGTHDDRRVSAYRERIGNRVMERETAKSLERLQVHLVEQFAELAKSRGAGTVTSVPLPVTTRGIGFNTKIFLEQMSLRNRHVARVMPNTAPLYRVSLLQAKHQLFRSQSIGMSCTQDFVYDPVPRILNDSRFRNLTSENSFLMKLCIDCFGCVEDASRLYRPYVPPYNIETYGKEEYDTYVLQNARYEAWHDLVTKLRTERIDEKICGPPPPSPAPVPAPYTGVRVDPFLVTFDNLRDTVESLASPDYPRAWRRYFRKFNPIPTAEWNADDVLMNPNAIMPADYTEVDYATDLAAVAALFNTIKGNDQRFVSQVNFTGLGSKLSLATLSLVSYRNEEPRMFAIEGTNFPEHTIRNSSILEDATLMSSILALSTELPPGTESDEQWAIRSPRLSMRSVNYSWYSLVTEVTNARF